MAYPVSVSITPQSPPRNRLTTFFRVILAIPHAILVGALFTFRQAGAPGLLGAAAYVLAVVSWVSLVATGRSPQGIRDFTLYYLRWRTRALAYMALFVDPYPPFGDGPYPASLAVGEAPALRDRTGIALRLIFAIPHFVALFFVLIAWGITSIIAWFAILFTGVYPVSLYSFGTGVMQWLLRFEAYLLLLVDEYPPFAIE